MMRTLLLATALLAGACEKPEAELTQVIVLVGGDPSVDALDVRVLDAEGQVSSDARTIDLTRRAPGRLPTSFTIVPSSGKHSGSFRVLVQGLARDADGGTIERARVEATASFSAGNTTLLPVILSERCADETCGCVRGTACASVCRASLAEGEVPTCLPVPTYTSLTLMEPSAELDLAEGIGACGKGALPGPSGRCEDLDECAFFLDACDTEPRACINRSPADGRYQCQCPPGHVGNGQADSPCMPCDGGACAEPEAESRW